MSLFRILPVLLALLLAGAGAAQAQFIVLKDGNKIPATDISVENGQIIRTISIGDNKTATTQLQKANIASLDWQDVEQVNQARELMTQGKTDEAIALLAKAREFFGIFETFPGSPYTDVSFAYVEALSQGGKFEETIKAIPQVRALKLTDAQKMRLRIIQLDIDRQTTSDYAGILLEAKSILSETDDSAVGAAIWTIIAEMHARKKEWENALMAYLRIPVFYGTQLQRVPEAELKAGQMLVKMKRYEDAQMVFDRVAQTYAGSPIGQAAVKEKAAINGMKNVPEGQEEAAEAEAAKGGDAAKPAAEGAAPAAPAAPPAQ